MDGDNKIVKDTSLDELIEFVNCISNILKEHGIAAKIDFDHKDRIIIIKYRAQMGLDETTCIINSNNMLVSGIDYSKLWMPDYSKSQRINRKILNFLEAKGYKMK